MSTTDSKRMLVKFVRDIFGDDLALSQDEIERRIVRLILEQGLSPNLHFRDIAIGNYDWQVQARKRREASERLHFECLQIAELIRLDPDLGWCPNVENLGH